MKKKIKKWLVMILSLALLLGGIQYTPMSTEASEENITIASTTGGDSVTDNNSSDSGGTDTGGGGTLTTRYYTFAEVTEVKAYNVTGTVKSGTLNAAYTANYGQIAFTFPAGVDTSTMTKLELIGENVSGLALKVYTGEIASDFSGDAQVAYSSSMTIDSSKVTSAPVYFLIMNISGDAADYRIDGIGITAVQTGGSEEKPSGEAEPEATATPVPGESEVTTKYYTFDEVTENKKNSITGTVTAGTLNAAFVANYGQIAFTFPAGVDTSTMTKLELIGENVSGLALKVYTGEIANDFSGDAQVSYSSSMTIDKNKVTSAPVYFVIMNISGDAADYEIYGLGITAVQTGGSDEKPSGNEPDVTPAPSTPAPGGNPTSRYYTFKDVKNAGGYGYTEDISDAGVATLDFNSQYQEVRYTLPDGVDASTLTNLTLDVTSDNVAHLAIKILVDGSQAQVVYGTNTIDVTADLSKGTISFAIMNKDEGALEGVVIENIKLTAVQSGGSETEPEVGDVVIPVEPETYTITVYPSALTKNWTNATTAELLEDNRYSVVFGALNNEARLQLPATIDLNNCKSITFNVKEQVGPVNFYVGSGEEKLKSYWYNVDKTSYVLTPGITDVIDMVGVQAGGESAVDGASVVLESVIFTMNIVADEADITYGIAPVDEEEPPVDITENITPVAEGEEDFSWKSDVLPEIYNTSALAEVDDTVSRWNISFDGQWQEIRFELPESVDLSTCSTVTFAVPAQTSALTFKMYSGETEVWAQYHAADKTLYTYELSAMSDVVDAVAIMMHADDLVNATETCSFDGVMFDMLAKDEIVETYEVSYNYSDLVLDWTNATSCELVDGGYLVNFSALNEEARFKIPESINLEKCQAITFKVASQNGPVNLYLGSDATKIETYYYNIDKTEYTKAPTKTNKINTFTVQCGGETYTENASIIVIGVTFIMEGKAPLPTPVDGVYTYEYFEVAEISEGVTVEADVADGSTTITFPAEGDSIVLVIPDSVDINHLVSIDFNMDVKLTSVPESALVTTVLNKKMKEIFSTTENSITTNCHSEVKYIKFTSAAPNTVLDLKNIKFNIDLEAFEAIVLNGNFDREDLSMWGSALWGSVDGVDTTITAEVSDTPIYNDVYTYGHLSDRSSPYVCFAQDITDRVKEGQWYQVDFWVRLDAEDYKDAGASLREITCSPYYLDENGKENYSLIPYGVYKGAAEPGVWTSFICKIYVPYGMTGYVLRIMEQGTSYGQGNCLMGSYDITGVTLSECEAPPVKKYSGGGSSSTNTTITKEATWTGAYNMEDLLVEWASATYTKNSNNGLDIKFKNNYDEVRMDLPRELDMSTAAYVKAKVSSQNVPIAVKLYYKGSQVDVGYYNNISSEYTLVPSYTGKVDAIGIMSLATPNPADAYANFESITFGLTEEPAPLPVRTEIVLNGDFADADLADWKASFWGDGVTMTQKTSSKAIASGVYNYAEYSKRTSPYQCFAQDITDMVEEGETYTFSFWAKLSEDYVGAPEAQRIIQFAPYTTDSDGISDYNPKLEGTYLQVCEPGVWTYFEGTYKVTNPNDVKKVVIRILEQGTNYGQGDCVLGSFAVADVKMAKYIPEPPSIDEDVPNLKDVLPETFGEDFLIGTAVTLDEIDDIGVEMLVNKHFNAVTLGNELKPDALFNYSNSAHTELQTITFNGESLEVPTLSFYRAEEILDKLLEWNETHPESPIKVRGHVLVWHSQTPEWFFREGYVVAQNADGTENYVTPEVMNLRLEWYIKTVLEHFTGEDSKYKELFYGWDVVNEAVSNGGNGYRTDKVSSMESPSADTHSNNSSWWAVYQSNEFIINAFKYANMYAPADVELYYNDYNECDNKKMVGIVKLLKDVKEAEGTRIDGMGMQAHYNMFNPSVKAFETAIRAYAEVVGEVHITEWDTKASGSIDNDEKKQAEYLAQGERYRDFYEVLMALDAEEGIEIGCITFWGTVDHHSWLQESSTVGGGADGDLTHCPLLFSDEYKVKPAYWAFVDYSVIDPDYEAPTLVGAKTEENKEDAEDEKPSTGETSGDAGKTEEPVTEATPEPEKQEANAPATEAPKANEAEEGNNIVPIAVGGGVAGVGVIGALIVWLKKRKKVS